jgi:hypothetical protein
VTGSIDLTVLMPCLNEAERFRIALNKRGWEFAAIALCFSDLLLGQVTLSVGALAMACMAAVLGLPRLEDPKRIATPAITEISALNNRCVLAG